MVKIDFTENFWLVSKLLQKWLELWMRKSLLVLLEELKRLTPEDTKEMLNSYRVGGVTSKGENIVGEITNDADHAIYVEYWVDGVVFNYHKPKWNKFYSWIGNRTFARAIDNKREEILNIIAKESWLLA